MQRWAATALPLPVSLIKPLRVRSVKSTVLAISARYQDGIYNAYYCQQCSAYQPRRSGCNYWTISNLIKGLLGILQSPLGSIGCCCSMCPRVATNIRKQGGFRCLLTCATQKAADGPISKRSAFRMADASATSFERPSGESGSCMHGVCP